MAPIFRNYKFILGAFATIMLILLIRFSSNSGPISRNTSPTAFRPEIPNDVLSVLPIETKPGYVDDERTNSKNPAVADAVKENTENSSKGPKIQTGECTKDPQYVVMIDAGSSGSRVHVYKFDVCYQPPRLLNEDFKMLKPGLSSYDTDAIKAAHSLDELLDLAVKVIPEDKRGCSPVAVKATAGLRKLGEAKSAKILAAVRQHLEKDYPFPVVDGDEGVSVMGGDQEGVYAWITTNYLLGNIGGKERLPTSGVFDLGGGSTQIVFEPSISSDEQMVEGEHKYELAFGGEKYTLYQFSHLGYGLMEGRNKINALLVEDAIKSGKITKGDTANVHTLISPCLPPAKVTTKDKVKLESGETYLVNFKGPETAAGAQCRFLADKILNKDAACKEKPCSFNGVYQPSLVHAFKETNDLYIFSFFYDRTRPLAMPLSFKLDELMALANTVCNGEKTWTSVFAGMDESLVELEKDPYYCMDLSFQVSLLHTGYDIPLHRELRTAQTIEGNELGWCLGASLPLLEGTNWKCRVKQLA